MYNNILAIYLRNNFKGSKFVNKLKLLKIFNKDDFIIDFVSKKYGKIKGHKSNTDLFLINDKIYDLDGMAFIGVVDTPEYSLSDFTDGQHYSKDNKFIGLQHKTNPNLYYNEVTEELYDESTGIKTKLKL